MAVRLLPCKVAQPLVLSSVRGHGRSPARVAVRAMATGPMSGEYIESLPPGEILELMVDRPYLDVRTATEFAGGHPKGAVNIPMHPDGGMQVGTDFVSQVEAVFPDKAQPIIVGCRSGARSLLAIDVLRSNGYESLVDVATGYLGWASQQLPVEE